MHDFVTPEKILNELMWLKVHNHVDVEVNEEWVLHAGKDDHNLYDSLRNTESEPPIDIDSTEVAVDANANSEFTNDISNCDPTTINTEVHQWILN